MPVSDGTTRIFSDIHYGEASSRVRTLAQLAPLCDGPAALVLNGDTLDTRPGPDPERSNRLKADIKEFFSGVGSPVTFVTGNHDPDFSHEHAGDFADGQVFLTHGDILFDGIVPWARDAALIRERMRSLADAGPPGEPTLEERLRRLRRVAASVSQRHSSERYGLKYAIGFAADTLWPPWRIFRILKAWGEFPSRAGTFVRRYRPRARFVVMGHTHWPGVWTRPSGVVVINTGSFCSPAGGLIVDIAPRKLSVLRVNLVRGEYRPGRVVREFALAGGADLPQE